MKKVFNKIPKKVRYTTGIILFLVLLVADAKCSQTIKRGKKMNSVEEIRVIEPEQSEEPEPNLETFEDLQSDYEQEGNKNSTAIEEIDDTICSTYEKDEGKDKSKQDSRSSRDGESSLKGPAAEKKPVVIDESDETMKDETKGSKEKEYDADQEPQGKLDWEITPKPEKKGTEINGDVPAGGKQGVGVWS